MFFKYLFPLCFSCYLLPATCYSQGAWVQKASVFTTPRAGVCGFSIGTKGYLGTGWQYSNYVWYDDFWEWDQLTNAWTQKANFPDSVADASGFSIGTKGYIIGGIYPNGSFYSDKMWEWNQINNTWTQKTNFPGGDRAFAIGFSIGNFGYFGTGYSMVNGSTNDFWEWNQSTNTWSQKANFPPGPRAIAVGFAVGNKGYIGTGDDTFSFFSNDFWEYDPLSNSWTQQANLPGGKRCYASGFSIGGYGYIGTGYDTLGLPMNDFWRWEQTTNTWTQVANYPHPTTDIDHAAFSIGCKGYFGTGADSPGTPSIYFNDFWEYIPLGGGSVVASISASATTICAGQSVTLTASGGSNYAWNTGSTNNVIVVSPVSSTNYSVLVSDICGSDNASITIYVTPLNVSISGNTGICLGDTAILTANGGTTFSWSTGDTTSSITVSPTSSATYSVVVSNGVCTGVGTTTVMVVQQSIASFTYQYDLCKNNCVKFIDQSSGAFNWCWNMGDGGNAFVQNPCWQYSSSATYNPSLIINCNSSCSDTFSLTVPYEVHDTSSFVFIPNAFSPNGDGENDVLNFQIKDDYCVKEFYISIFDRWGEKVFETSDIADVWNGIFNGRKLNAEVYVYYCRTTSEAGSQTFRKGNVTLLR